LLKVVAELVGLNTRLSTHVVSTFALKASHRDNVWDIGALKLFEHECLLLISLQLLHELDLVVVVLNASVLLEFKLFVESLKIGKVRAVLLDEAHWHELEFVLVHSDQLVPPSVLIIDVVLLAS